MRRHFILEESIVGQVVHGFENHLEVKLRKVGAEKFSELGSELHTIFSRES